MPLASTLILCLVAAPTPGQAPEWNKNEIKTLFMRASNASRAATVQEQDNELANVAGAAYRVMRQAQEGVDQYARRTLKKRDPSHPNVKEGTWLTAAIRQLYSDLAVRADQLARFETSRQDRAYLEEKAAQARAAAESLSTQVVAKVEGVEGFMAPLPVADADPATEWGATAIVRGQTIVIENLDRITFENNAPPAKAIRTPSGSLRELMAAQKQFNITAQMLGRVDPRYRKGIHIVRTFIPGAAPALYLNELARAAKEAGMHQLIIMTATAGQSELREIAVEIPQKKKRRKKRAKAAKFRCKDTVTMQACVEWALEVKKKKKKGALTYRFD